MKLPARPTLIIKTITHFPKHLSTDPLKRRSRTKCHTAQTLAPFEATVTQLTDTVGDNKLFNSSLLKTGNTDPLKRR